MPHLLGLEVHSAGLTVAAMRPDQTIVLRPVDDLASVLRRTNARRWKWSLGVTEREDDATEAANELFLALQHALGDAPTLVGAAVPALWNDRARRALLRSMEDTTLEVVRLVRDSTALAIGAAHHDPSVGGVCVLLHLGTHKLELSVAEVSPGKVRVRARKSVAGLDGANVKADGILPLITAVARFTLREAGVAATEVTRFVCAGRRVHERSLHRDLQRAWSVPVEASQPGAIAVGAALVAAGLSGVGHPWEIIDDLGEAPLASLRGAPGPRITRPPPPLVEESPPVDEFVWPPVDEVLVIERYRSTAPPPPPSTDDRQQPHDPPPAVEAPAVEAPASGAFVGLRSPSTEGFARPTLATLLQRFISLPGASGILTLRHRSERIVVPIEGGNPCLTPDERAAVLAAFTWPEGTFAWRRERVPWAVRARSVPMAELVAAGLRACLDASDAAAPAPCDPGRFCT
ncbi:MAG: Hsp70 family protein [Myxococcales bacterium]|nr:Hsp70 family protein [Myxococcales bacterium]